MMLTAAESGRRSSKDLQGMAKNAEEHRERLITKYAKAVQRASRGDPIILPYHKALKKKGGGKSIERC